MKQNFFRRSLSCLLITILLLLNLGENRVAYADESDRNGITTVCDENNLKVLPKTVTGTVLSTENAEKPSVEIGTESNPYIIRTINDLKAMAYDVSAYYELANDIDMKGVQWKTPIGNYKTPFSGHLDGNGHTIANLIINQTTDRAALFGTIKDAEIKNITLDNETVTGKFSTGGLVAYAMGADTIIENCHVVNSHIEGVGEVGGLIGRCDSSATFKVKNCSVDAQINLTGYYGGGIVGEFYGDMEKCWFTGAITSTSWFVGGLVGSEHSGSYEQCYVSADITAYGQCAGFIGRSFKTGLKLSNCFVLGSIRTTNETKMGGMISEIENNNIDVTNCYCAAVMDSKKDSSGYNLNAGITKGYIKVTNSYYDAESSDLRNEFEYDCDRLAGDLARKDTFVGWDFDSVWEMEDGSTRPYLQDLPIPEGIAMTPSIQGKGSQSNPYIITSKEELKLLSYHSHGWYVLNCDIDLEGEAWKPLAAWDCPFKGHFDGLGHTIYNLNCEESSDYVGFFSNIRNANIHDLYFDGIKITGKNEVGGLAGYLSGTDSIIDNIQMTNAEINCIGWSGGIIGWSSQIHSMTNCSFRGTVEGTGSYIGGLVGYYDGGTMEQCYANAEVKGYGKLGGMFGSASDKTALIKNCYATGKIAGEYCVGNMAGYLGYEVTLENVYVAMKNNGRNQSVAFSPYMYCKKMKNCYYDKKLCWINEKDDRGKTTSEMLHKDTFENWDFNRIWKIEEGVSYPYLRKIEIPQQVDNGLIKGCLIHAKIADVVLPNLSVHIRQGKDNKTGDVLLYGSSDANGLFSVGYLGYGEYTMEVSGTGYITEYINVTCKEDLNDLGNVAMMPRIGDNEMSIVLSWGKNPVDLDTHFKGEGQHISYSNLTGIGINIDMDGQNANTPETMTIDFNKIPEGEYMYYVNWYSGSGASNWKECDATIKVYMGDKKVYEFHAADTTSGTKSNWYVFSVDTTTRTITPFE